MKSCARLQNHNRWCWTLVAKIAITGLLIVVLGCDSAPRALPHRPPAPATPSIIEWQGTGYRGVTKVYADGRSENVSFQTE
jgi:hypothetical protein